MGNSPRTVQQAAKAQAAGRHNYFNRREADRLPAVIGWYKDALEKRRQAWAPTAELAERESEIKGLEVRLEQARAGTWQVPAHWRY